jgi:hypothetical protein
LIKKSILIPVIGVALIGGGLFVATSANAQTPTTGFFGDIAQRIAQRFNLNKGDVQKVFDEVAQERHDRMHANLEERLNQAVKDGKITDVQKTAILGKLDEWKNNRQDFETFKDKTPEERKQIMDERKSELEKWAKDNGLTLQTLHELVGQGSFGFGMRGGMHGMWR